MRLPVSANFRFALFALLVLGSLSLKAAAGPPRDRLIVADSDRFEREVTGRLQAQDFATSVRTFQYRNPLVLAARGNCRLAVRDATFGSALTPVFAKDARSVGPLRFFYRGATYESPPGLIVRLTRLKVELLDRLGVRPAMPIVVALASSSACGGSDFGLSDLYLDT